MPVGLPACYPEIIHSAMLPLLSSGTLTAEDACPAIDCVGMRRANLHMCHHEATRRELTQPMQRQHATGGIIFAQQMPSNSPATSRWRCAARGAVRAHKAYRAALCFVLGAQGLRWGKPVYPIARGKMGKPSLPCANADTFGQILALPSCASVPEPSAASHASDGSPVGNSPGCKAQPAMALDRSWDKPAEPWGEARTGKKPYSCPLSDLEPKHM